MRCREGMEEMEEKIGEVDGERVKNDVVVDDVGRGC